MIAHHYFYMKIKVIYHFKPLLLISLWALFLSFDLHSNERDSGGINTHQLQLNHLSFSHPSPALTMEKKLDFFVGKAIFEKIWVFAPSSTTASDGLGPLYNARSCIRCHKGNGRGLIEENNSSSPALFLRLSIPPTTSKHLAILSSGKAGFIPEPVYGKQLQTFAYPGGNAEGQLKIEYSPMNVELISGESIQIQKPEYKIEKLGYGPIHQNLLFSPRIAPPLIGLGLLEAIDENDILQATDVNDLDNDGISGKANIVWDENAQRSKLGRFGWKAGSPSLDQQNNSALSGDLGISSWMFPKHSGECTKYQTECLNQMHGNKRGDKPNLNMLEASKVMTDLLLFYMRNIALPPARNIENLDREKGKTLFYKAGCQKCHRPSYTTSKNSKQESLSNQTIWLYSDLLLHDMGKGLADDRPEFLASGTEWRTPPLWGIGLTKKVSGNTFYLHDGRARNLLEAIMWHGGEAEASKQEVITMTHQQRQQLIYFLESL
jgi:CxxC motif-containing protein (DUF1111 family)